jgi:hypothetical protein
VRGCEARPSDAGYGRLARLQHVMVSPAAIGDAAKSVLVLVQSGHKMIS